MNDAKKTVQLIFMLMVLRIFDPQRDFKTGMEWFRVTAELLHFDPTPIQRCVMIVLQTSLKLEWREIVGQLYALYLRYGKNAYGIIEGAGYTRKNAYRWATLRKHKEYPQIFSDEELTVLQQFLQAYRDIGGLVI